MLRTAFALFALMLLASAAQAEKRVALVIGNGAYIKVPKLDNPKNDAAAMEAMLKAADFDTVRANDLGVTAMRRALRDFSDKTYDADIAIVFYAGHGIEVGGINYLIPTDAVLERDIDAQDEAVSLDRVSQLLEPAKRLRLVILDACRDNPFVRSMRRTVATRAIRSGYGEIDERLLPPNTLVAYAQRAGATAEDGSGTNSPYTTALLKHLPTPGLDIELALRRVRDDVLKMTRNRQEPFRYGSLGGAEIPLVAVPAGPPPTVPTYSAAADAARVCREVEGMSSLSMLGVLANQHKGTPAGDCIAARMGELNKREVAVATPPVAPTPVVPAPEVKPGVEVGQDSKLQNYARASGLFTDQDAERVAAIVKKHNFIVPAFDFTIPDSHIPLRARKLIGVWASEVGYGGTGRQVMLIVTNVTGSQTVKGFNVWCPPTGHSFNRNPAGFQLFEVELVGDTLTWGSTATVQRVVRAADANLTITDKLADGRMVSAILKPIWRLVDARERDRRLKAN